MTNNGFQVEQHKVTTDDGYVLTVFRIPGKIGELRTNKPPVFFQHGILDSADCWIMNTADVAPAFVAARAGYDVWLGNSRGNKYSKEHIKLDPYYSSFWMFDWQQMGDHDIPAVTEHIIRTTGHPKIAYVGHSQGTTQLFYALAHNENYFKDKISIFVALGPVMQLTNVKSGILWFLAQYDFLVINACQTLGIYDIFPANWLTTGVFRLICGTIPAICEFGVNIIADENTALDKADRLQTYMGHFPSGTSLRTLIHFSQIIQTSKF